MPSKRTFARRLGALVATGLGVNRPIGALTSEPPPAGTLAINGSGETGAATGSSAKHSPARQLHSAVANGAYKPAAVTSRGVDTVVTARFNPSLVTMTGVPQGVAAPIRDLLSRYDSVSLDRLHQVAGGTALTTDGPEGCGVIVGDIDARTLRRELTRDADLIREPATKAGFTRFKSKRTTTTLGVRADEVVIGHASSISSAVAHRDAGISGHDTEHSRTDTDYGSLPSRLHGDATVCVDLGTETREYLRRTLSDAPKALRTAVDAAAAVGVACSVTPDGSGPSKSLSATPPTSQHDTADTLMTTFRYGAVADPKRLDRETAEVIARAAREGESSFSDATVSRHGRTVILETAADGDIFAPHAELAGVTVGDVESLSDS
ncbi:hypothetical protein DJ78_05140 [Halorubrum ezzemoulense]|uniref:Uncharacterized protein n=2 Tax=Halorubrum ezzemoulense TaxID=337243 RepID=A0A256JRK7_HALEZ|nr:hypothetical protein DJ78_05140 [Halorubrum ezzemoulense]